MSYDDWKSNINEFKTILEKSGLAVTVRRTLGSDINASCGQLRREDSKIETNIWPSRIFNIKPEFSNFDLSGCSSRLRGEANWKLLRRFWLQKRPLIQRAQRWSLSAESEIPYRSKAPPKGEFQRSWKRGTAQVGGSPFCALAIFPR